MLTCAYVTSFYKLYTVVWNTFVEWEILFVLNRPQFYAFIFYFTCPPWLAVKEYYGK